MRFHLVPLLLVVQMSFWLAGCSTPPAAPDAPTGQSAKITEISGLFPKLEIGMSATIVREKLGSPAEIRPISSPTGHAEIWVYHFDKSAGTTQVATGTVDVPAFSIGLSGPTITGTPEPTYSTAEKKSLVTLSLLMFNEHLAAQKAAVEHVMDYN